MSDLCSHKNSVPEVMDQTLGVACNDCNLVLGYCWGKKHVSESVYNRACMNDLDFIPCAKSRDNFCAVCGDEIKGDDE